MTTVSEAYTWAAYGAALKTYLGIADSSEDVKLQLWWEGGALLAADQYIDRDFVDEDDDTIDLDITTSEYSGIKLGLFEWMELYRKGKQEFDRDPLLKSQKTDDLAEVYGDISELVDVVTKAVERHWWPFKRSFFG